MALISIVLPIYNAQEFLEACLTSICSQTLEDIEVWAVNDGSTDASGRILDDFAARDSRINALHQEKRGQAFARNRAISMAQGEYIGAIDADDWAETRMFASMYEKARECQADIVMCGWKNHIPPWHETRHYVNCIPQNILLTGDSYRQYVFPNLLTDRIPGYFWQKLYKRELIQNNGLHAREIPNNSDWVFACEAFTYAKSLFSFSVPLYHHRYHVRNQRLGSYRNQYFDNILYLHRVRSDYLRLWTLDDFHQARQGVLKRFIEMSLGAVKYEFLFPYGPNRQRDAKIRQIVNHPEVRRALAEYDNVSHRDKGRFKGRLYDLPVALLRKRNITALSLFYWLVTLNIRVVKIKQQQTSSS